MKRGEVCGRKIERETGRKNWERKQEEMSEREVREIEKEGRNNKEWKWEEEDLWMGDLQYNSGWETKPPMVYMKVRMKLKKKEERKNGRRKGREKECGWKSQRKRGWVLSRAVKRLGNDFSLQYFFSASHVTCFSISFSSSISFFFSILFLFQNFLTISPSEKISYTLPPFLSLCPCYNLACKYINTFFFCTFSWPLTFLTYKRD